MKVRGGSLSWPFAGTRRTLIWLMPSTCPVLAVMLTTTGLWPAPAGNFRGAAAIEAVPQPASRPRARGIER